MSGKPKVTVLGPRGGARAGAAALGILLTASVLAGDDASRSEWQPPTQAERRDLLKTEKALYSGGLEEVIIRDFFQDMPGGFFVDVGAAHYKALSTTFYLEERLQWSGIGIDALEEYAAEYGEYRPNTEFVNVAITDKSGETISFFRSVAWREISSVDKSIVEDHGKRWRNDDRTTEIKVPTLTLDKLLTDREIETIDLLSMDIEGSEPAALRGFDIERFRPKLVCIEALEENRPFFLEYFSKHSYRRIERYDAWDNLNWYFTPVDLEWAPR